MCAACGVDDASGHRRQGLNPAQAAPMQALSMRRSSLVVWAGSGTPSALVVRAWTGEQFEPYEGPPDAQAIAQWV